MQFRVLKIKTAENTYEYILTNLPYSFNLKDIKDCYHMRWGCEISFRYLKHANGLLYFHSKKPEFLMSIPLQKCMLFGNSEHPFPEKQCIPFRS